MLGVTVFGLFLTPVFYLVVRRIGGRTLPSATHHDAPMIVPHHPEPGKAQTAPGHLSS